MSDINKINALIKAGIGKDWYYRAEILKAILITDDEIPLVILEVYYAEPEQIYLKSTPLLDFK